MSDEDLIAAPTYLELPRRYSLAHRGCLLAIAILMILAVVAFLVPATVPNGGFKERMRCANNLKQIGLALHNYAAKYRSFPPAYTVDKNGRRMHSWRMLILEFLDPQLYGQYDFRQPWDSPANLVFAKKTEEDGPYRCPAEDVDEPSWTSYVMLVGPRAISPGPTGGKPSEITDGLENTAMIVEMSPSGILWTAPNDLDVSEMSFQIGDPDHPSPRSRHDGSLHSAQALFADGHIDYLSARDSTKDTEQYLKAVSTVNGHEDMSKFSN